MTARSNPSSLIVITEQFGNSCHLPFAGSYNSLVNHIIKTFSVLINQGGAHLMAEDGFFYGNKYLMHIFIASL